MMPGIGQWRKEIRAAGATLSAARFRRDFPRVDRRLRHRFELLVAHKASLHRRILLWQRVRELFHYWHVFHKPFAVVMYLFMVLHIGVAWITGYARLGH